MENVPNSSIRSICVYCGSSPGNDPDFKLAASALGRCLAVKKVRLVYGGGDKGLMGAIAESVISNNGQVLGIIPEFLLKSEQSNGAPNLAGVDMHTVPDMHTRKRMMFEESDAFVAMPGGVGTLEELVEVLTWAQLGRHSKPVGLLNINNFWSPYVELTKHMENAGFLHNADRAKPLVFESAEQLVDELVAA